MDFKGINTQYIKKYHIELAIMAFLGLTWVLCRLILAFFDSKLDEELFLALTYAWFVSVCAFILLFAESCGWKNIITEIGRNLYIHIDADGVRIEDTIKHEKINRTFRWNEIAVLTVKKRKTLFSLKKQLKVFCVIADKRQYEELLNQYREGTIITRKRKEMLNSHFVFQYSPEVMQYIEEHWGKVEE